MTDWPITMDECARRLHISRRLLQDILKAHPHYRIVGGRRKLFAESDFNALVRALPCRSASAIPDRARRRSTPSAGRTAASISTEALALATAGKRKRSSCESATTSTVVPFPTPAR
jgi:hypothetical protein